MKKLILLFSILAILIGGWFAYQHYASPTRVAFVNYMDFMYDNIVASNSNASIKTEQIQLEADTFKNADKYDALYLFAHGGVRLTQEQKEQVKEVIDSGTAVVYYSPVPTPELEGLGEENIQYVNDCLKNSTPGNIRRMLNYTRRVFDGKKLFVEEITDPFVYPRSYYYHLGDEEVFEKLDDYIAFLKESGRYTEGGKNVALVASMFGASTETGFVNQMVEKLEANGYNVFPMVGYGPARVQMVQAIQPDIVVYNAHGKFGGEMGIQALKEANIPLLCPIVVFTPNEVWRMSKQGMDGGLLSMNVALPELDGGAVPFVIGAQFKNERGLYVFRGVEERIDTFIELTNKFFALKDKENANKKLAIFYLKEAGRNALVAENLEVVPSLWNLLNRLKEEGYDVGDLPATPDELEALIQEKGPIFGSYAEGSIEQFRFSGHPELMDQASLNAMLRKELAPELVHQLEEKFGPAPGEFMSFIDENGPQLMISRIELGNIVLLPVPPAAGGSEEVEMVHGAKSPPPYPYVGAYLWARTQFSADAILHFGTHGSVEFTPEKQVALSDTDWPDALLAGTPHFYVYVISNVGEATIAKRRSYAVMQSHLTSPLTEAGVEGEIRELDDLLKNYWSSTTPAIRAEYRKSLDQKIRETAIYQDLEFELPANEPVTEAQLSEIHDYIHSVGIAKIINGMHVLGEAYSQDEIDETVHLMANDALIYNMIKVDQALGLVTEAQIRDAHYKEDNYLNPARQMIEAVLNGRDSASFLNEDETRFVRTGFKSVHGHAIGHHDHLHPHPHDHSHDHGVDDGHSHSHEGHTHSHPSEDSENLELNEDYTRAFEAFKDAFFSIADYRDALIDSPKGELDTVINSLNGGYTAPQSGGDPAFNPEAVPSGRNHYSINAEKVPTMEAYTVAKRLVDELLSTHLEATGDYPERVALTLWSSEFIRQEGITIAEAFYLLGVKPVADRRGTIHDVELIPIEELGRPRIDVVVQTSGQFRDIAASRIYLINRAVEIAAQAKDEGSEFPNNVRQGVQKAEEVMKERGASPADARKVSSVRVFGGLNGSYGASIMGMVEDSDSWESEEEVADRYLLSMGAMYGKGIWGEYQEGAFEAALSNAEMVIQPRSANTWGALSLDHVYEFMGGISNAIRKVSGNDPAAYFSDLRNPNNPVVQSLEEAIWMESRTTLLNPKYIRGMQAEGATAADTFAETFRNSFSWEVMKPTAVDPELWDNLTKVYIDDIHDLGIEDYFREKNPYALQEMTAVMLETVRKGYWEPSTEIQQRIAKLHAELVRDFEAGCSGFVCDNSL
ncbi:MAG: cobaltochelatase subunit CobN, partial [Verrucomicrobiota bacterium]